MSCICVTGSLIHFLKVSIYTITDCKQRENSVEWLVERNRSVVFGYMLDPSVQPGWLNRQTTVFSLQALLFVIFQCWCFHWVWICNVIIKRGKVDWTSLTKTMNNISLSQPWASHLLWVFADNEGALTKDVNDRTEAFMTLISAVGWVNRRVNWVKGSRRQSVCSEL